MLKPEAHFFLLPWPDSVVHLALQCCDSVFFLLPRPVSMVHPALQHFDSVQQLNAVQHNVAFSAANIRLGAAGAVCVVFIQGPPGTGKSTTITAMVLPILYRGL